MTSRHSGSVPRRTNDAALKNSLSTSTDRKGHNGTHHQRLVSPPKHASEFSQTLSSSVMEVDEKKRQTSIQDYFFVKRPGMTTTTTVASTPSNNKRRKGGRGGGIDGEFAHRMPLKTLSPNGSEISYQSVVRNSTKDVEAGVTDDCGLPTHSDDGDKSTLDGRRVTMPGNDELREKRDASGGADLCPPPCSIDSKQRSCSAAGGAPPKLRATKRQYQQLFLDFGQRDFAKQQICGLCGMMVVHGVEEDIRQHEKICREYRLGVPFHCDTARAVAHLRPDSVIYQIRPSDSHSLRKKVEQVRQIVDKELGFVVNPSNADSVSTFLYARNKRVIGLCSVLPIQRGYVLSESNLDRSREPQKATIGIHQIWVHSQFRGMGVATALVDAVRERLIFGMVVPARRVAFSSPSQSGASFARRYVQKSSGSTTVEVLVYDAV